MPNATILSSNELFIDEGDFFSLACIAIGYPAPSVIWNGINGTLISGRFSRISVSDSISEPTGNGNITRVAVNLTIANISREDTGVYTCSATNFIGSDKKNVSLTIQCKFTR